MNRPGSSCNVYTVTRGLARYGQNRFYWKNWDFCAESLIYITKSDDETDGVSFWTWASWLRRSLTKCGDGALDLHDLLRPLRSDHLTAPPKPFASSRQQTATRHQMHLTLRRAVCTTTFGIDLHRLVAYVKCHTTSGRTKRFVRLPRLWAFVWPFSSSDVSSIGTRDGTCSMSTEDNRNVTFGIGPERRPDGSARSDCCTPSAPADRTRSGDDETDGVSFSTWAASVVMITAFTDEMWWRSFGLAWFATTFAIGPLDGNSSRRVVSRRPLVIGCISPSEAVCSTTFGIDLHRLVAADDIILWTAAIFEMTYTKSELFVLRCDVV